MQRVTPIWGISVAGWWEWFCSINGGGVGRNVGVQTNLLAPGKFGSMGSYFPTSLEARPVLRLLCKRGEFWSLELSSWAPLAISIKILINIISRSLPHGDQLHKMANSLLNLQNPEWRVPLHRPNSLQIREAFWLCSSHDVSLRQWSAASAVPCNHLVSFKTCMSGSHGPGSGLTGVE